MEPEVNEYVDLLDRIDLNEWANEIVGPFYEDCQEAIQASLLANSPDASYRSGLILGAMLALKAVEDSNNPTPQPGVN